MFKPIPVAIGLRYLRAKRRNGFISFISLASILGIAIGVAALITTLAVMSGFQREIRDRMLQMAAHATISADGAMDDWRLAVDEARKDKRVAGAAPYIEIPAMLAGPRIEGALVRAVIPNEESKVSVIAERMVEGKLADLTPGSFNIVLGKELALWAGVGVGDKVVLTLGAAGRATPVGAIPRIAGPRQHLQIRTRSLQGVGDFMGTGGLAANVIRQGAGCDIHHAARLRLIERLRPARHLQPPL